MEPAIIPGPDWSQAALDSYSESLNQMRVYYGWTAVETQESAYQTEQSAEESRPFFTGLSAYQSNYYQFFLENGSEEERIAAQKYLESHGLDTPRQMMLDLGRIPADTPRISAAVVEMAWNDYLDFVESEVSQGKPRSNHSFTIAFAEMLNRYVGGPDSQGEQWICYYLDETGTRFYRVQYRGSAIWYSAINSDGTRTGFEVHSAKEVADMYPPIEPAQPTTSEYEYAQWLFGPDTDLFDSYYAGCAG